MTKPGDHGDRFGGLLIGYIGLITVPVALEIGLIKGHGRRGTWNEMGKRKT